MTEELLAKLEAATGPDREIAFALFEAFEATPEQREKIAVARERVKRGELVASDILRWRTFEDSHSARALSSIDAALALVEEVLPGSDVDLEIRETMMDSKVTRPTDATIYGRAYSDEPNAKAYAPTPALALCLALLRASKARGEAGSVDASQATGSPHAPSDQTETQGRK